MCILAIVSFTLHDRPIEQTTYWSIGHIAVSGQFGTTVHVVCVQYIDDVNNYEHNLYTEATILRVVSYIYLKYICK